MFHLHIYIVVLSLPKTGVITQETATMLHINYGFRVKYFHGIIFHVASLSVQVAKQIASVTQLLIYDL